MNDKIIDQILFKINRTIKYRLQNDNNIGFDSSEYTKHFVFMLNELRLIRSELKNSDIFTLTNFGYEVIKNGGWVKHLEIEIESKKHIQIKSKLEFEKSKTDLDLAKKMLEEYPYTKWLARIGAFIGIVLGLKELGILIKKLLLL